jgi:hypothetical protein
MKKNLKVKNGGISKKNRTMTRGRTRGLARTKGRGRTQRGGYHQFMGNVARSYGYSVAGSALSPANLNEANPAPITRYSAGGPDNYNHLTGKGAQIWN